VVHPLTLVRRLFSWQAAVASGEGKGWAAWRQWAGQRKAKQALEAARVARAVARLQAMRKKKAVGAWKDVVRHTAAGKAAQLADELERTKAQVEMLQQKVREGREREAELGAQTEKAEAVGAGHGAAALADLLALMASRMRRRNLKRRASEAPLAALAAWRGRTSRMYG
jgi:hypothetical protein